MREIDDVEHAEDQREPDRQQEEQHAVRQPVQRLRKQISRHTPTTRADWRDTTGDGGDGDGSGEGAGGGGGPAR